MYGILDLDHALSCLTREDPSLRVSTNQDTGQTVLSGMGELHLEIIHDRIKRDFKVDCSLGKLQVAYREAPSVEVKRRGVLCLTIPISISTITEKDSQSGIFLDV